MLIDNVLDWRSQDHRASVLAILNNHGIFSPSQLGEISKAKFMSDCLPEYGCTLVFQADIVSVHEQARKEFNTAHRGGRNGQGLRGRLWGPQARSNRVKGQGRKK